MRKERTKMTTEVHYHPTVGPFLLLVMTLIYGYEMSFMDGETATVASALGLCSPPSPPPINESFEKLLIY